MRLLRCSKCKEHKPEDAFFRYKRIARGRTYMCRSCTSAYYKQRGPCPKCGGKKSNTAVCCKKCGSRVYGFGPESCTWKGGRVVTKHGYVLAYCKGHPAATKAGVYVHEHRLVMEKMIGRYLVKGENVHHKNGNRSDNRPENLELWNTHQPQGKRPCDLIKYAKEILAQYEPEALSTLALSDRHAPPPGQQERAKS